MRRCCLFRSRLPLLRLQVHELNFECLQHDVLQIGFDPSDGFADSVRLIFECPAGQIGGFAVGFTKLPSAVRAIEHAGTEIRLFSLITVNWSNLFVGKVVFPLGDERLMHTLVDDPFRFRKPLLVPVTELLIFTGVIDHRTCIFVAV